MIDIKSTAFCYPHNYFNERIIFIFHEQKLLSNLQYQYFLQYSVQQFTLIWKNERKNNKKEMTTWNGRHFSRFFQTLKNVWTGVQKKLHHWQSSIFLHTLLIPRRSYRPSYKKSFSLEFTIHWARFEFWIYTSLRLFAHVCASQTVYTCGQANQEAPSWNANRCIVNENKCPVHMCVRQREKKRGGR